MLFQYENLTHKGTVQFSNITCSKFSVRNVFLSKDDKFLGNIECQSVYLSRTVLRDRLNTQCTTLTSKEVLV